MPASFGLIQFSEELDPKYRHASIDPSSIRRFTAAVSARRAPRRVVRHLIDDRGHHRLTIDPARANTAAIRTYEKVGFRAVGVRRQYERDVDGGGWHDGPLMKLLAEEVRGAGVGPRSSRVSPSHESDKGVLKK